MKILMITNPKIEDFIEDDWIAKSFEKDGHEVKCVDKTYNEKLEGQYDIFLNRNSYSTDERDFIVGEDPYYFKSRLRDKQLPRINCDGKFDGQGKSYLCELYKKGYQVIPSVESPDFIDDLPCSQLYMLKPHNGLDGFGIKKIKKSEICRDWNKNYIIQPVLAFTSEVQFYFVGNQFEYALEFKPSKVPVYPKPSQYSFKNEELKIAQSFADLSPNYNGVQRIDFLKLKNGELKLCEIEDSCPYLDLVSISKKVREHFIKDYKNMVYDYFKYYK